MSVRGCQGVEIKVELLDMRAALTRVIGDEEGRARRMEIKADGAQLAVKPDHFDGHQGVGIALIVVVGVELRVGIGFELVKKVALKRIS